MYTRANIEKIEKEWKTNPRWKGIERPYKAEEVVKLQGSLVIDYPLAKRGAERFWKMLSTEPYIQALGAITGNQAVQMVQAGLKAIYISGWQIAADNNDAYETYPDQSLYPTMSGPHLIRRINNSLRRADQIQHMHNEEMIDWYVPLIADAEAGFGGPLNCFELIKAMIEAGAAAIHLEDQLSSLKKCGHMGGKVLVSAKTNIKKLVTARLASDIMNVPTLIIARTDALSASMIRSDYDEHDKPFLTGDRSPDGYYYIKGGVDYAIQRGIAFAPYADMIWCETSKPDLGEAKELAQGIHEKYPGKWLAYNCSPSFNWKKHLDENSIRHFQDKLAEMGYKFQFVTLAGFHTINASMFKLAHNFLKTGMLAYSNFQDEEFVLQKNAGYKAINHQTFVGTGYFDEVMMTINQGETDALALKGSTEEAQFND